MKELNKECSKENFPSYVAEKIFKTVNAVIDSGRQDDYKRIKFKTFTQDNCLSWVLESGERSGWENVGFVFPTIEGKIFALCLAHKFVYIAPVELFDSAGNIPGCNEEGKGKDFKIDIHKSVLLEKGEGEIYEFLGEVEEKIIACIS